jgi:hypothetical protein
MIQTCGDGSFAFRTSFFWQCEISGAPARLSVYGSLALSFGVCKASFHFGRSRHPYGHFPDSNGSWSVMAPTSVSSSVAVTSRLDNFSATFNGVFCSRQNDSLQFWSHGSGHRIKAPPVPSGFATDLYSIHKASKYIYDSRCACRAHQQMGEGMAKGLNANLKIRCYRCLECNSGWQ